MSLFSFSTLSFASGATLCNSPASVVSHGVDVIVTMAGFPKELEEIVYGADGLVEGNVIRID